MRIAARFADEFNITGSAPDRIVERYGWLDEACHAIGRDPATITRSAMVGVMIAADTAGLERRADAMLDRIGRTPGGDDAQAWLAARRPRWVMGTYEEARAALGRFEAAGVQRIMLQDMLPWDLEMIEEMGRELVGHASTRGVEPR